MQDQTDKRLNIASNAVTHATALLDAINSLDQLRDERAVAGNFVEADFDGSNLQHLTPAMVGVLLDIVVPRLVTAIDDATNSGQTRQLLNEVRR